MTPLELRDDVRQREIAQLQQQQQVVAQIRRLGRHVGAVLRRSRERDKIARAERSFPRAFFLSATTHGQRIAPS
jgi:hypothetical protein